MKKILFGLFAIMTVFILVACGDSAELEEQIADLELTNSNLESEITRLEAENAELTAEIEELTAEIEVLTAEPEAPEFDLEDLMGTWENGSGENSLGGFLSRIGGAGAIRFEEDSTVTTWLDTPDDDTGRSSIWQLNDEGLIVIEGDAFAIEINGNLLTITNDEGAQRMFQRADDEPEAPEDDEDEAEEDEEESSSSSNASTRVNSDFVGTWALDVLDIEWYVFNANGTGTYAETGIDFTWEIDGNELVISLLGMETTRYTFRFTRGGNRLSLTAHGITLYYNKQ